MNINSLFASTIITFILILAIMFVETIVINCIILYIVNKHIPQKIDSVSYQKLLWKTFGFCILADFLAYLFIVIVWNIADGATFSNVWISGISIIISGTYFDNISSNSYNMAMFFILFILLSAILIFIFSRLIIFRKFNSTKKQKMLFSLAMAVCSAPYFILIPYGNIIDYLCYSFGY